MKKSELICEIEVQSVQKTNNGSEYEYLIKIDIKELCNKDKFNDFDNYLLLSEEWFQGEKFKISCEKIRTDHEDKKNIYILKKRKSIIIRQQKLIFLKVMEKLFNIKINSEDKSFNAIYETWKKGEVVDINLLRSYDVDEIIEQQVVQNFLDNSKRRISKLMEFFKENRVDICTQVEYLSEMTTEFKYAHQLWPYTNTDLSMLDRVAYQMNDSNVFELSTERMKALLGYYIKERISNGTIYIPISEIYNSLSDYLLKKNDNNQEDKLFKKLIINKCESQELIYRSINDLVIENKVILSKDKYDEEVLFTPYSYQILNDYQFAYLEYLKGPSPKYEISNYNHSYSYEEMNLFNQILMNDISIITGGPGTRKNNIMFEIYQLC